VEKIRGRRSNSYRLEAHHTGHLSKVWGYVTLDESGFVDMRMELGKISAGWFVSEILDFCTLKIDMPSNPDEAFSAPGGRPGGNT